MIRLKKDDGSNYPEWEEKTLAEISTRIRRKNSNNETDIPLTISSVDGLVNQKEYFNKIVASKDMSGYYLLKKDEFAYNKSYSKGFDFGSIKRLTKYEQGALSTLYICFDINKEINKDFISWYFDSQKWTKEVSKYCAEGARNHGLLNISPDDFFKIKIKLPVSIEEQQKIADFLSSVGDVITESEKEVVALEEQKKGVMQKIFSQEVRFKADDGSDYPKWEEKVFTEIFEPIATKSYQIQTSECLDSGTYEVVDQGQSRVSGYSNLSDKVFNELPIIVYGDHTTIVKYRIKEFIIGADGTKLLRNKNEDDDLKYLFYCLCKNNVPQQGYKRHFSDLKKKKMPIPCSEEQQKIANFLSDFDTAIDLAKQELEQWKELKKGLLQQLFE